LEPFYPMKDNNSNVLCYLCYDMCQEARHPYHEMEESISVDGNCQMLQYTVDLGGIPVSSITEGDNLIDSSYRGKMLFMGSNDYFVTDLGRTYINLTKGEKLQISSAGYTEPTLPELQGYKFKLLRTIQSNGKDAGVVIEIEKPDGTTVNATASKQAGASLGTDANGHQIQIQVFQVMGNEASIIAYDMSTQYKLENNKKKDGWIVSITSAKCNAVGIDDYGTTSDPVGNANKKYCLTKLTLTQQYSNNSYGIYLYYSSNNTLTNNTANLNKYAGICLLHSSNNTLTNNTANWNGYGIYILDNSNFNQILNNDISNNSNTGITISTCDFEGWVCPGGNSNNTIEENKILNNKIGIFSNASTSIINSNFVCGNKNLDFDSSDWGSSVGKNNTCDNADEWNDTGKTGCANLCTIPHEYILTSSLTMIHDLINYPGNGIIIGADNITLDCNGHEIRGYGMNYGIYLNNKSGITIKNCVISGFKKGIYLEYSSKDILTNNTVNSNNYGIYLNYSSNNTITNNTANNNNYGIYLQSSSNNIITNNTANNNNYGIYLQSSSNNIITNNTPNNIVDNNIAPLFLEPFYPMKVTNCNELCYLCYDICQEARHPDHEMEESISVDGNCQMLQYTVDLGGIPTASITEGYTLIDSEYRGKMLFMGSNDYFVNDLDKTYIVLAKGEKLQISSAGYVEPTLPQLQGYKFKLLRTIQSNGKDAGVVIEIEKPDGTTVNATASKQAGVSLGTDASGHQIQIQAYQVMGNEASIIAYDMATQYKLKNNEKKDGWIVSIASAKCNAVGIDDYGTTSDPVGNANKKYCLTKLTLTYSNRYGIYLYSSLNNTLTDNIANSNDYGIYIFGNSNFNEISNNEISNNRIGIFSNSSNSTINHNLVCGNMQWDFNSSDWQSSSGDNNTCNNPYGWNDTSMKNVGKIGCTNKCQIKKATDIFDVVEMLEHLSNAQDYTSYYDMDDDGQINLLDVFSLIERIVVYA